MAELYTTLGESTLNGAINDVVTTVTVASASSFPSSGNFRIGIDAEIMKVTGVSGSDFTVVRGQEGTSGASHGNGAVVKGLTTASALDDLRSTITQAGLLSSLPAVGSSKQGDVYIPTDGVVLFYRGSSAWERWGPILVLTKPVLANYSRLYGTGTGVQKNDGVVFLGANGSTYKKSISLSTPYRLEIGLMGCHGNENYHLSRLFIRNSSADKNLRWGFEYSSGAKVMGQRYTGEVYNSTFLTLNYRQARIGGPVVFFAMEDDGTDRKYQMSFDHEHWVTHATLSNTDHMSGQDEFGIELLPSTNYDLATRWVHVREVDLS